MIKLDDFDLKILARLQEDASTPLAELAEEIGLSSTPCWRRIQKLENAGLIRKRVALLDIVRKTSAQSSVMSTLASRFAEYSIAICGKGFLHLVINM